jgi:hypothetical protein
MYNHARLLLESCRDDSERTVTVYLGAALVQRASVDSFVDSHAHRTKPEIEIEISLIVTRTVTNCRSIMPAAIP